MSPIHGQSEYHLTCPHPVSTTSLLSMSSQNIIASAYFELVHHLSCPCPVSSVQPQSVHDLSLPCPVRIWPILPIDSQSVQLYYPYPARTPLHLPMSSQYRILIVPCPVSTTFLLSMYSQNAIPPTYLQLVHHLSWPCHFITIKVKVKVRDYSLHPVIPFCWLHNLPLIIRPIHSWFHLSTPKGAYIPCSL